MGERGPGKTPMTLAVVRGQRADRINTNAPVPSTLEAAPPMWLSEPARAVWDEFAPDLIRKGVLTGWDTEEFGCWCDAAARRRRAVRRLDAEGEVIEIPVFDKNSKHTGNRIAKNPWLQVLSEADRQVISYGTRFGMTPSDRASLNVPAGPRGNNDDLLSGAG